MGERIKEIKKKKESGEINDRQECFFLFLSNVFVEDWK